MSRKDASCTEGMVLVGKFPPREDEKKLVAELTGVVGGYAIPDATVT